MELQTDPGADHEMESLLDEAALSLADLQNLILPINKRLHDPPRSFGEGYYQSPISKAARTFDGSLRFDDRGAFQNGDTVPAALIEGFGLSHEFSKPLSDWLETGKVSKARATEELFGHIRRRVAEEQLISKDLYKKPICRLVYHDQLRYDSHYHAIYQLTPGQMRINEGFAGTESPATPNYSREAKNLGDLLRNQRIYWGISEILQSLIAMFDSDLGRLRELETWEKGDLGIPHDLKATKELLRISDTAGKGHGATIDPSTLNQFSPLRFWSPPPAFARCVFHMLFWRSMITGRDLFNREIYGDTVAERARGYFIIVNTFNASKYRVAGYAQLMEALVKLAKRLENLDDETSLSDYPDLMIDEEWPYPAFRHDSEIEFPIQVKPRLTIPLKSAGAEIWELLYSHQETSEPTKVCHLRKVLRDRILQVMLWSRYQMEIRSLGIIPVQHLYQVELEPECLPMLDDWRQRWKNRKSASSHAADDFDEQFAAAILAQVKDTNGWVRLRKVYGGTFRDLLDPSIIAGGLWPSIKRLTTRDWAGEPSS